MPARINALWWLRRPWSLSRLGKALDGAEVCTVSHHVQRLVDLGALEPVGHRWARTSLEKLHALLAGLLGRYWLAAVLLG
jgi:hypothetical protein